MTKLFSRAISILTIFVITFTTTVFAEKLKVNDTAKLFTNDQIVKLEEKIDKVINEVNMDVAIVTTNNTNSKSSRDYADDYYDSNGYGIGQDESGLVLLINMQDREIYISTKGSAIDYFTDKRIDSILDNVFKYLKSGDYYEGADAFLNDVGKYVSQGIPSGQQRQDENETTSNTEPNVFVSLLISAGIAAIPCGIIYSKYKNPKRTSAQHYIERNSIDFTDMRDNFVNSHVTKVKIQRNNNSGGGNISTTHRSSSGDTHGGGGRGF